VRTQVSAGVFVWMHECMCVSVCVSVRVLGEDQESRSCQLDSADARSRQTAQAITVHSIHGGATCTHRDCLLVRWKDVIRAVERPRLGPATRTVRVVVVVLLMLVVRRGVCLASLAGRAASRGCCVSATARQETATPTKPTLQQ
jgi:hypothetical protein